MVYITRKEHFNAAHKLWNDDWSEAKNFEVFGKCANPNWHGHNFDIWVTVKGEIHSETGFVMDLKTLKSIIKEKVLEPIDHRNINLDVPFMSGKMASTENLAIAIWEEIKPSIEKHGVELHCVKLDETMNNSIEYYG